MALSLFAGIRKAIEYAYGCAGCGTAALQVVSGSNAAGTYTITCSPAQLQTSDGLAIPISTGTPITIGADSAYETVTPSAVALNGQNQLLITAAFTFAHGPGAQVRSGTFGLAEAVNAANNAGGGVVAVDAAWKAAGGANATITGTKGFTDVSIIDARGTVSGSAFSYAAAANGDDYAVTAHSWY